MRGQLHVIDLRGPERWVYVFFVIAYRPMGCFISFQLCIDDPTLSSHNIGVKSLIVVVLHNCIKPIIEMRILRIVQLIALLRRRWIVIHSFNFVSRMPGLSLGEAQTIVQVVLLNWLSIVTLVTSKNKIYSETQ